MKLIIIKEKRVVVDNIFSYDYKHSIYKTFILRIISIDKAEIIIEFKDETEFKDTLNKLDSLFEKV